MKILTIVVAVSMALLSACSAHVQNPAVTMNSDTCQKVMFDTLFPHYREKPYYAICTQEYGFTDTPHEYKATFWFKGVMRDLLIFKPLEPVKVNYPMAEGRATMFSEAAIEGRYFWLGYYIPTGNSKVERGLFYRNGPVQRKLVVGNHGFFKSFRDLHFAFVVDDSDQHRDFTTVYLIGTQPSDEPWVQRIYVLAGSIVDAVVIDGHLLISGTEQGRPFAAHVGIDAHPPIFDRLSSK